ncbi:MAG: hypothetical protein IPK19_41710 [Chloroflexi bacterium]|nr:hypothetical protein [Chloroflexota bacterium]
MLIGLTVIITRIVSSSAAPSVVPLEANGTVTRQQQAAAPALTLSRTIDFDRVVQVPLEFRASVSGLVESHAQTLPEDTHFYATAFRVADTGDWARIVLMPAYVVEAGWENFRFEDMVEILAWRNPATMQWDTALYGEESINFLHQVVPSDFIYFSAITPQAAVEEYRFPWNSSEYWWKNGGWHDGYWGLPNNAIDFQAWDRDSASIAVLAAAPGVLDVICGPDIDGQVWYKIANADGNTGYGHLDSDSARSDLLGNYVARGQFLAEAYSPGGSYDTDCGYGGPAHVHFVFPHRDISMYSPVDGRSIPASEIGNDDGVGVIYYNSNNVRIDNNNAPSNVNLLRNTDFAQGTTFWTTWGGVGGPSVSSGVYRWYRTSGSADWASVLQDAAYRTLAGARFELTLDLGNSSGSTKNVQVNIRNKTGWDGYLHCTFDIPPNTPLRQYTIRAQSGAEWKSLTFEVDINTADGTPYLLMDNVNLRYRPDLSFSGTQCIPPLATATPTSTSTATRTSSPTPTFTSTPSRTPSPTATMTRTPTPTWTPSLTYTPTNTRTPTLTYTPTSTSSPTATATASPTPSPTSTTGTGAIVSLAPASTTTMVDGVFDVAIWVKAGALPVNTAAGYLDFDPALLQVEQITGGGTLTTVLANSFNNVSGQVNYAAGLFGSTATGDFVLATVRFRAEAPTLQTAITFNHVIPRQTDVFTEGGDSILAGVEEAIVTVHESNLDLSVTLQGRPPAPHARWVVPLHVMIRNQTTNVLVLDTTLTTDTSGHVTITGLANGTYRVWAKHSTGLAVVQDIVVTGGSQTLNLSVLREGDANNNNSVTIGDFSILASSFGSVSGGAGFDARADFNGDSAVTVGDFSLLASNFGLVGVAAP